MNLYVGLSIANARVVRSLKSTTQRLAVRRTYVGGATKELHFYF